MKKNTTAILLALFTGFFGGHRFYLGQTGLGVLYLLFSWTFIPLGLSILDALVFIFQSPETFNSKYNSNTVSKLNQNVSANAETSQVRASQKRRGEITPVFLGMLEEIVIEIENIIPKLVADKGIDAKLDTVDLENHSKQELIGLFIQYDIIQITKILSRNVNKKGDPIPFSGFLLMQRFLSDQPEFYIEKSYSELNTFLFENPALQGSIDTMWNIENPMSINYSIGEEGKNAVTSELCLPPLLQLLESDLLIPYATLLHRIGLVLCKHDITVSPKEEKLLQQIYELTHNPVPAFGEKSKGNVQKTEALENKTLDQALKELHDLIGLTEVKEEIQTLVNFVKIQQQRELQGLKVNSISYHIVFTGNPGTGKTTVARLLAQIYKELGLISKGHLVETDRSGMIAEYAGQTAVKVNKVVDEALDGVLFIDEAYSLVGESKDDYGKEAVATLIKRMEDDRKRLIVVLAGYSKEMENFIETNPGFKSRINRYIDFRDYGSEEMLDIFKLFLKQSQYKLDAAASAKAQHIFETAYSTRDKSFGNGRFVRNVFEKSLENQANRLAKLTDIDRKVLIQIEAEDISVD